MTKSIGGIRNYSNMKKFFIIKLIYRVLFIIYPYYNSDNFDKLILLNMSTTLNISQVRKLK